MDNKVGYAILSVLLINVVVVAAVFVYLQNEIDTLKPQQPLSSPTAQSTPILPSTPVSTSATPPASKSQYSTVTYQWTLKPEYRGNQTWLEQALHGDYNSAKSWKSNYIT